MGVTRAYVRYVCVFDNRPYSSYGKNTPLTVDTSTADACGCRICLLQPLHAYSFRRKGSIPRTAVDKRLRFARRRATHDGRRTDNTGRKHKKCRRKTDWTARGGRAARMPTGRARICVADRPATAAQRHGMPPEARKRPSAPSQAIGRRFPRPKAAEGRKGRSCASGATWPFGVSPQVVPAWAWHGFSLDGQSASPADAGRIGVCQSDGLSVFLDGSRGGFRAWSCDNLVTIGRSGRVMSRFAGIWGV